MRFFARVTKQLWTAGLLSLVLATGACGDDGGNNNPDSSLPADANVDAVVPDGMVDATPPEVRAGTVAVTHVTVSNDLGLAFPVSGAAISVSFSDPAAIDPTTVAHQSGSLTAGCTVFNYTVGTNAPAPNTNEGAVTISGDFNHTAIPPCAYVDSEGGYRCIAAAGQFPDAASVTHDANPMSATFGLSFITLPGATFDNTNLNEVGMYLTVNGFALDLGAPFGEINNGSFGIVNVAAPTTVAVINSTWNACLGAMACNGTNEAETVTTATVGDTYSVVAGAGPMPNPVGYELFDTTADPITINIAKAAPDTGAGQVLPAFDISVKPSGFGGFVLSGASDTPEAMPFTARDITIECDNNANECGGVGELVTGFAVSGRTTDATVNPADPTDMPDPVTSYATFTCTFIGEFSSTIPQAAWQAVLDTNPTRIETRVLRLGAKTNVVPDHDINLVAGYGYVGFTDAPAAAQ